MKINMSFVAIIVALICLKIFNVWAGKILNKKIYTLVFNICNLEKNLNLNISRGSYLFINFIHKHEIWTV